MNVYSGKETTVTEGTLGERVVMKQFETVSEPHVALCYDRFLTTASLLDALPCWNRHENKKKIFKVSRKTRKRTVCVLGKWISYSGHEVARY
jgi:hypothetical protein